PWSRLCRNSTPGAWCRNTRRSITCPGSRLSFREIVRTQGREDEVVFDRATTTAAEPVDKSGQAHGRVFQSQPPELHQQTLVTGQCRTRPLRKGRPWGGPKGAGGAELERDLPCQNGSF